MTKEDERMLKEILEQVISELQKARDILAAAPVAVLSDTASVNLYVGALGEGRQEQSLIWMRFSAFLVAHSLLLQPIFRSSLREGTASTTVGIVATAGLVLAMLWWLMNYAGWWNQNLRYWVAHKLPPPHIDPKKLPTSYWDKENLKPHGPVYLLAQAVPVAAAATYSIVAGASIKASLNLNIPAWGADLLLLLLAGVLTWCGRRKVVKGTRGERFV